MIKACHRIWWQNFRRRSNQVFEFSRNPVYTKGQHLYGFNLAKDSIKTKDAVIVVEGYFDVITSHLYGFDNTVATCGTALTEQQAKSLVRYTDSRRVYLLLTLTKRASEQSTKVLSHSIISPWCRYRLASNSCAWRQRS